MAGEVYISKIHIGNQDYLIKDSEAHNHMSNTSNPHGVTKAQIGLGSVENKTPAQILAGLTSAMVTGALGYTPINPSTKGQANGVASLDGNGKVPAAQLPSFVDDVVPVWQAGGEFFTQENCDDGTQVVPESGKIYIDMDDNKSYRWIGTNPSASTDNFVEISSSLALGTTASSAFRGDYGQTAYNHATETKSGAKSSGLYKISVTAQGHVGGATAVTKADITALGIPAQDTTYTANSGIKIESGVIKHTNAITADGNDGPISYGVEDNDEPVFEVRVDRFDAQGHKKSDSWRYYRLKIGDVGADAASFEITPSGTVSKPNITVTPSTDSFVKASVSGETLTLTSANAVTGVSAALASAPVFSGETEEIQYGILKSWEQTI